MKSFQKRYERHIVSMKFDPDSSKTHTEFKKQTDINNIVEQYVTTGTLPTVRGAVFKERHPMYGDFSVGNDFQEIQNTLLYAQNAFFELPSRVREHFRNNPAELAKALHDPARLEELQDLGIVEKRKVAVQEMPAQQGLPATDATGAEKATD